MEAVTPGWVFVTIGFEGDPVQIDGVNMWEVDWISAHGRITVAHPSYPAQRHTMWTYRVDGASGDVHFAAGEFSNGVWGFFVPEADV